MKRSVGLNVLVLVGLVIFTLVVAVMGLIQQPKIDLPEFFMPSPTPDPRDYMPNDWNLPFGESENGTWMFVCSATRSPEYTWEKDIDIGTDLYLSTELNPYLLMSGLDPHNFIFKVRSRDPKLLSARVYVLYNGTLEMKMPGGPEFIQAYPGGEKAFLNDMDSLEIDFKTLYDNLRTWLLKNRSIILEGTCGSDEIPFPSTGTKVEA